MSKCTHCGSSKFGPGCPGSINGLHQHNTDDKRCMFCGSSSYGNGCLQTPSRKHIHGSNGIKCKWCGAVASSQTPCKHSPTGKHET